MSIITPFQALACPLDGEPLALTGSVWRCAAGHSFDIAKQGYVNLLPVQHKRSHDPGDSKAMVAARQRFLGAGYYQPIADAVSDAVFSHAGSQHPTNEPLSCLDAGCGEGYYLRQLAHAGQLANAAPNSLPLSLIGLDISKWAVLAAAKQDNKQAPLSSWVVGSNAHIPVQTETLDSVLCMFGFPVLIEFARVLRTGGLLLQVEAGPNHLRELREVIYPTLKPERSTETEVLEGFIHHSSERVSYPLALNGSDAIADLLAMTPHLYRASAEGRARAAALEMLSVTVDARIVIYTRI
ncbi:MAG: rRNA (guanine-N1-)-methyltransferase [Halomonas sp. 54_146]|nr:MULTISPECIES: methyltransferase domain-containing protein [unclassified Halomonas]KUJ87032.1 MAG: rRNA (guanine-N1-)-methyltransferase [Halomonas sp. 54_146]HAA46360.1 rRNA (guanine-N1)-methyltransferase [Halomonas sp.]